MDCYFVIFLILVFLKVSCQLRVWQLSPHLWLVILLFGVGRREDFFFFDIEINSHTMIFILLKYTILVAFNIFIKLWHYHRYVIPEHFYHFKDKPKNKKEKPHIC